MTPDAEMLELIDQLENDYGSVLAYYFVRVAEGVVESEGLADISRVLHYRDMAIRRGRLAPVNALLSDALHGRRSIASASDAMFDLLVESTNAK